jgi:signal transduction histidine kinase
MATRPARISLRTRTMLASGALALVTSALVAVACYELTRVTLVSQRERGAERQTYVNARSVRSSLVSDPDDGTGALGGAQTAAGGYALLRVRGTWFSTSVSAGRGDVPGSLLRALDDGAAARQRVSTTAGPAVAVGVPLTGADAIYVEFVPFAEVDTSLSRVARGLAVAVVVATLVGLALGRWLAARLLRPLRRTAEAARGIRAGELDRRLGAERDPDLLPLVESFDEMVDELQLRIERERRFASDVTHELRSPLATMDAALSVARRRTEGDEAHQALDVLEQEMARFRELIVDLLEIGRAEAGMAELALEEVEPVELVRSVLRTTHRADAVELVVAPGAEGRVVLDKRRVGQALVNLLDNADNYGGGATSVTVEGDAAAVRIVVDDAGPGVPEHERQHVFGRFARGADNDVPGTGLGLALVAEHVRLHGGAVTVGDSPAGGARFVIVLPRERS